MVNYFILFLLCENIVSNWILLYIWVSSDVPGKHWSLMQIFHSYYIFFFALLGGAKVLLWMSIRNLGFNTFLFRVPFLFLHLIIWSFIFCPFYLELDMILIKSCVIFFYWNRLNHRWWSLIFRYFCWRQFGIFVMYVIHLSKVTHISTGVILHLFLICLELIFPSWHGFVISKFVMFFQIVCWPIIF